MDFVWDALLDAVIDTAKMMPLLYAIYVLIEFVSYKFGDRLGPAMEKAGAAGPVIGAVMGVIPQCGISVMGAALYTQRLITIGTLFAVYIATSDEAIPVILSQPEALPVLIPLIVTKLVAAIVVGYLLDFVFRKRNARLLGGPVPGEGDYTVNLTFTEEEFDLLTLAGTVAVSEDGRFFIDPAVLKDDGTLDLDEVARICAKVKEAQGAARADGAGDVGDAGDALVSDGSVSRADGAGAPDSAEDGVSRTLPANVCYCGCCAPAPEGDGKLSARDLLWYPLLHTLQVSAFIFAISFLLALLFEMVGEETIASMLEGRTFLQPIVAALIGVIPNCAASVAITELYLDGILTFGATIAGLAAGGGLGVLLLLEEDGDHKEAVAIVAGLIAVSIVIGLVVQALGIMA